MRRIASRIKALETDLRKRKISKRFEQVMALYSQVCLDNSYQINVAKITTSIELIDLAWILAICSLRKLSFKSTELIALKVNIYKKLIIMVNKETLERKLKQNVVNEVELHNNNSFQEIHSYILPPDVAILLLSADPSFIGLCINTEIKHGVKEQKTQKEKNFRHPESSNELLVNVNYTVTCDNRPSAKTAAKCEFIVKELEEIAMSFNMEINREILWRQLKKKCNDGSRFELGGKRSNCIIEKATGNQWERESLNYHMDRVVEWHRQEKSQFYSQFD